MEMKLKDAKEREENIERIHNTMLKAFKQDDSDSKQADFAKEYEYLTKMHQKQLSEVVKKYEDQITVLNDKNAFLQEKLDMMSKTYSIYLFSFLLSIA